MSRQVLSASLAAIVLVALSVLSGDHQACAAASRPGSAGGAKSPPLCEQFRKLLRVPGGLDAYSLEVPSDAEGNMRISNIDVDTDGIADGLVRWCPGSASIIPPDPCTLTITLSSGKTIQFEEARFTLIRYKSAIYAVAADYAKVDPDNPRGADIKTKIYRVDRSGVHLVCSKLP
jgi:hypothetical protein